MSQPSDKGGTASPLKLMGVKSSVSQSSLQLSCIERRKPSLHKSNNPINRTSLVQTTERWKGMSCQCRRVKANMKVNSNVARIGHELELSMLDEEVPIFIRDVKANKKVNLNVARIGEDLELSIIDEEAKNPKAGDLQKEPPVMELEPPLMEDVMYTFPPPLSSDSQSGVAICTCSTFVMDENECKSSVLTDAQQTSSTPGRSNSTLSQEGHLNLFSPFPKLKTSAASPLDIFQKQEDSSKQYPTKKMLGLQAAVMEEVLQRKERLKEMEAAHLSECEELQKKLRSITKERDDLKVEVVILEKWERVASAQEGGNIAEKSASEHIEIIMKHYEETLLKLIFEKEKLLQLNKLQLEGFQQKRDQALHCLVDTEVAIADVCLSLEHANTITNGLVQNEHHLHARLEECHKNICQQLEMYRQLEANVGNQSPSVKETVVASQHNQTENEKLQPSSLEENAEVSRTSVHLQ